MTTLHAHETADPFTTVFGGARGRSGGPLPELADFLWLNNQDLLKSSDAAEQAASEFFEKARRDPASMQRLLVALNGGHKLCQASPQWRDLYPFASQAVAIVAQYAIDGHADELSEIIGSFQEAARTDMRSVSQTSLSTTRARTETRAMHMLEQGMLDKDILDGIIPDSELIALIAKTINSNNDFVSDMGLKKTDCAFTRKFYIERLNPVRSMPRQRLKAWNEIVADVFYSQGVWGAATVHSSIIIKMRAWN